MKNQQNELERRLWNERSSIQRKHEGKVTVAQAKCVESDTSTFESALLNLRLDQGQNTGVRFITA